LPIQNFTNILHILHTTPIYLDKKIYPILTTGAGHRRGLHEAFSTKEVCSENCHIQNDLGVSPSVLPASAQQFSSQYLLWCGAELFMIWKLLGLNCRESQLRLET
jgi:hypothetical protein